MSEMLKELYSTTCTWIPGQNESFIASQAGLKNNKAKDCNIYIFILIRQGCSRSQQTRP